MFEYMFFDEELRRRFIAFATGEGVPCVAAEDSMGLVARVPEEIPEGVADALDDYYDELMEEQAELVDQADADATRQAAGVRVTLGDGRSCMVRLEPELANRLLAAFSLDEVQGLVQAIARSVENPDDGPVCKRQD